VSFEILKTLRASLLVSKPSLKLETFHKVSVDLWWYDDTKGRGKTSISKLEIYMEEKREELTKPNTIS